MALPQRGVLADVGCGNGKYFAVRPDLVVLASDRSCGLAIQAARLCGPDRGPGYPTADTRGAGLAPRAALADVIVADGMWLPYRVSTPWGLNVRATLWCGISSYVGKHWTKRFPNADQLCDAVVEKCDFQEDAFQGHHDLHTIE